MNEDEIKQLIVYWKKRKKEAQEEIDKLIAMQSQGQCAGYCG